VDGVSGYDVQFSTDEAFSNDDEIIARAAEHLSYRRGDLAGGTHRSLRVRSASGTGEARITSAWSAHVTGMTVEPAAEGSGLCRDSRATPSGSSAELVRDCGILLEARDALQGRTRGRGLNWNADLEIGSWDGVRSTLNGVVRLHLWSWGLAGTIPDSLGNLTNLEELNLTFNSLAGTIPDSLGNLTNLRILELRDNDLTGTIPASLGNLRNLQLLYLWDNNLTGAIPDSWRT